MWRCTQAMCPHPIPQITWNLEGGKISTATCDHGTTTVWSQQTAGALPGPQARRSSNEHSHCTWAGVVPARVWAVRGARGPCRRSTPRRPPSSSWTSWGGVPARLTATPSRTARCPPGGPCLHPQGCPPETLWVVGGCSAPPPYHLGVDPCGWRVRPPPPRSRIFGAAGFWAKGFLLGAGFSLRGAVVGRGATPPPLHRAFPSNPVYPHLILERATPTVNQQGFQWALSEMALEWNEG